LHDIAWPIRSMGGPACLRQFWLVALPRRTAARGNGRMMPARLEALRPPKRARPVIAVLAHDPGTETTDFIIPYAVLRASAADVFAVGFRDAPVPLMPALRSRSRHRDHDRSHRVGSGVTGPGRGLCRACACARPGWGTGRRLMVSHPPERDVPTRSKHALDRDPQPPGRVAVRNHRAADHRRRRRSDPRPHRRRVRPPARAAARKSARATASR
jgi:hypothetical protein